MRKHLKSIKNYFGYLGECRFFVNILNEPLRTRWATREGAGRPLVDGGKNTEQPPRPRETRNGWGVCGAVLVLCAMSPPRDMYFQILHRAAFVVCSSVLGMLSSAISAFERAYYHLPTRPEWRERAPGLSLRNSEVGAESARCVLVEFSAHFWASKSTFGSPLALLESEILRFIKVWFLYNFCMRWNQQFSCPGSANGQPGVIFWWVLG